MSQRTVGGVHLVDAQQVKYGAQHADAAANDQFAVVFHAVDAQFFDGLGFQQAVTDPVQAFAGDEVQRPACGMQNVAYRATVPEEP